MERAEGSVTDPATFPSYFCVARAYRPNKYTARAPLINLTRGRRERKIRCTHVTLTSLTLTKKITRTAHTTPPRGEQRVISRLLCVAGWLHASWRGGGGGGGGGYLAVTSRHVASRRVLHRSVSYCTVPYRTVSRGMLWSSQTHQSRYATRSHSPTRVMWCTRHASRLSLASPPYRRILVGAAVLSISLSFSLRRQARAYTHIYAHSYAPPNTTQPPLLPL